MSIRNALLALSSAVLLACGDDPTGGSARTFGADVAGDLTLELRGTAEFGPTTLHTEEGEVPAFGVVLGGDTDHLIGFAKPGTTPPAVGLYDLAIEPETAAEFAGAYLFFDGDDAGVFVATAGTLRITRSTANRIAGSFEIDLEGALLSDPETPLALTIAGTFDAGPTSSMSALRLAAKPLPFGRR